jgi:bis(5'-nucleosyl)-tetraphosphatase (symmetrical)
MALYLIGDLQGCSEPLERLLQQADFSPSRDTLYVLGDLVNRGPDSLGVLRRLCALGDAAQCLLGNHDLHLLALWKGVRRPGRKDTAQQMFAEPDASALLNWLRHRPMAIERHGWLMVHAGVLPQWKASKVMQLAAEVEAALRAPDEASVKQLLQAMYGNTPAQWDDALNGADRLRTIINALTRMRFCSREGVMEFGCNEGADKAPEGFMAWFEVPERASADTPIAFGHWSTLLAVDEGQAARLPILKHNTLPLDTGCVWGGCLSAAKLGRRAGEFELLQVKCDQALNPLD